MRQHRSQSGFTLLEMLVVLALTAVVTGIGTMALFRMTDYWNGLRIRTEMDRRAESVFGSIRQDIASLVSSSLASASVTGTSATATDSRFYGIALADDTLTLPVTAKTSEGFAAPTVITYHVKRDTVDAFGGGGAALVRSQSSPGAAEGAAAEQVVAEGVLQFEVEYTANGSEWVETWSDKAPPRAIRVSMTMAYPVNPMREQIARSYVFPVHVQ
ncbi:MAG: type II secretion system protein [Candidatus Hydrogenedentes bacterium]|nr:type II secretion system protein [Candidatus Hydrogenedentota bacterium]